MTEMILIKTPEQIEGIRKSSQLAARTLEFIRPHVVEGATTLQLNDLIDEFIRQNGATSACLGYRGFPKSVCTSINEVVCHGIPSDRVLTNGDIINIDVTTILDGYYGDTSTMFTVGEISPKTQKLLDVTRESLFVGIGQVKPRNRFGNIGYEINKFVRQYKFSVVYQFVGHGVGVQFHEAPHVAHRAKKNTGPTMLPGMIFTIEPMVNEGVPEVVVDATDHWTASTGDGKLSAQYEHTVLVTESGCEILTRTQDEDITLPDQHYAG